MHTVSLTINLTDEEFKAVGRETASFINLMQQADPRPFDWTIQDTLATMQRTAIRREAEAQRDRDTAAKEAVLLRTVAPFDPQNLEAYLLGRILQ